MAFRCPECNSSSMEIILALELPADAREDEIMLQVVECRSCLFQGIAVYGESRRGALDEECWRHDGYRAGREAVRSLMRVIAGCPSPYNPRCQCPAHLYLNGTDEHVVWDGLGINGMTGLRFEMIRDR